MTPAVQASLQGFDPLFSTPSTSFDFTRSVFLPDLLADSLFGSAAIGNFVTSAAADPVAVTEDKFDVEGLFAEFFPLPMDPQPRASTFHAASYMMPNKGKPASIPDSLTSTNSQDESCIETALQPRPVIDKNSAHAKTKAEDRRRRNRESSARCYQKRKLKVEARKVELATLERRAVDLYARQLELREENARLKKQLVRRGGFIPLHMLGSS